MLQPAQVPFLAMSRPAKMWGWSGHQWVCCVGLHGKGCLHLQSTVQCRSAECRTLLLSQALHLFRNSSLLNANRKRMPWPGASPKKTTHISSNQPDTQLRAKTQIQDLKKNNHKTMLTILLSKPFFSPDNQSGTAIDQAVC